MAINRRPSLRLRDVPHRQNPLAASFVVLHGESQPASGDAEDDRHLPPIEGQPGLYRLADWHTFLGYTWRMNAWMMDYYGNARVGGASENVTSLSRNPAQAAQPFRPIRYLQLDRDTPQVLVDGVALQQAGGVLGLEEFSIGTMSAWGAIVASAPRFVHGGPS